MEITFHIFVVGNWLFYELNPNRDVNAFLWWDFLAVICAHGISTGVFSINSKQISENDLI